MSADLFAEFAASPPKKPAQGSQSQQQPSTSFSFFDDLGQSATQTPVTQAQPQQWTQPSNQAVEDNDDWGDFEGGPQVEAHSTNAELFGFPLRGEAPQPPQQLQQSQQSWQPPPVAQTSNFDAFGVPTRREASELPQKSWQPAPVFKAKKSYDSNVLFDAEEEANDDDDFGDFEDAPSDPAPVTHMPSGASAGLVDLQGDMTVSQPIPKESKTEKPTIDRSYKPNSPVRKTNAVGGFGTVSRSAKPSPATASRQEKEEEKWDSFDDWEASIPTKAPPKGAVEPKPSPSPTPTTLASVAASTIDEVQPGEQPPTNVPPPSVLLSLFPPLFAEAQNKLFKPMAAQTLPMRNKLLAEPATISYLQAYLLLGSVAARIIAGRKLRWKRDAHLSQGMKIGPASSRATSGMKLTGIDKSENMREEREASDVVRAWKEQIGRLRHIVSAANQAKADSLGVVPDIQETLHVRTLKQGEGGISARLPCMVCGLKREERISTIDQAVDDSFGEWWVDQVSMHRGCRNFWNEHKDKLRQR